MIRHKSLTWIEKLSAVSLIQHTRNQKKTKKYKKKLKQTPVPTEYVWFQSKISEGSPNGTRKTMEKRIYETDEF